MKVFDNLLSPEECKQIIDSFDCRKKSIKAHNARNDKISYQTLLKQLPITDTILKRLKAVYFGDDDVDSWNIYKKVRLVHYVPGQIKEIHRDTKYSDGDLHCKYTLIIYLNDNFDEGHTVGFPDFTERTRSDKATIHVGKLVPEMLESSNQISVKPKVGRAAMYDIDLIHMGEPITSGEKWLLVFKIMTV
jgi:hypothetical protein